MDYKEFLNTIKDNLQNEYGVDYQIEIRDVVKNNNMRLQGLVIRKKDENVSPTIYLNNFFENYIHDYMSIEQIINEIKNVYDGNKFEQDFDINEFQNFEKVRGRIAYKIVNYYKNEEMLKNIPYTRYLDLAVCYFYMVDSKKIENATIQINNEHIKMWNVDIDEVDAAARENTPVMFKSCVFDIFDVVLENMSNVREKEELMEQKEMYMGQMLVLSNERKLYGATSILYHNLLKSIYNKIQHNFYILPSSIHEVIIVPDTNSMEVNQLKEMVECVNKTEVDECEILSDNVYYYENSTNEITCLTA